MIDSGLFNANMSGIVRSGVAGSFSYQIVTGRQQMPVDLVSWYDAIRFANWLNNGQAAGDTEAGAYTLGPTGTNGVPINGDSITRILRDPAFCPVKMNGTGPLIIMMAQQVIISSFPPAVHYL